MTLDALYTAVGSLKGKDAMKAFLRDLLTPSERVMLGRRIIIARMILAGGSYDAIGEKLHVGKNTISKVHKWLEIVTGGSAQKKGARIPHFLSLK